MYMYIICKLHIYEYIEGIARDGIYARDMYEYTQGDAHGLLSRLSTWSACCAYLYVCYIYTLHIHEYTVCVYVYVYSVCMSHVYGYIASDARGLLLWLPRSSPWCVYV